MERWDSAVADDVKSIFDAIRIIVKSLRQASKFTEKQVGLSAAQFFVLQKIAESGKPLSINDLAAKTFTHQSSVSVVVTRLVEQKLVNRGPSKRDARVTEVRLSKKGAALLRGGSPLIQERLADGVSRLSAAQRRNLVTSLQALIKKAGFKETKPPLFFEEGWKNSSRKDSLS